MKRSRRVGIETFALMISLLGARPVEPQTGPATIDTDYTPDAVAARPAIDKINLAIQSSKIIAKDGDHLSATPTLKDPEQVAQTSCFPRSAAFLVGTREEPQTCKRRRSALPAEASRGPAARRKVTTLPPEAQAAISAVLGRDDPEYGARREENGLEVANARHNISATFTPATVEVRSGRGRWRMALGGWGYGDDLTPLAAVSPTATLNRLEYQRGPLAEWYVNGPAGLEQGFTLKERPGCRRLTVAQALLPVSPGMKAGSHRQECLCHPGGPALTLALTLSGDFTPALDPDRHGLTLTADSGRAVLRYSGLAARDATSKALPSEMELRGNELFIRVQDRAARYPVVIDPWVQLALLTASDGVGGANFGYSVAVDGDTVVVGAPGATVNGNAHQGAAYVFVEPAGGWASGTQTAKLTASDGAAGDYLGNSVGISGGTVVVGAPYATVNGNAQQGAAYVFVEPTSGWANGTQTAKLTASDGAADNNLGYSVGISGDTVVVGAPGATVNKNAAQGAAYVFVEPTSGWASGTQTAKLTASDGKSGDNLGSSVADSGGTVVVGAPYATVNGNAQQGAAYVFVEPTSGWASGTQTAKLTASDGESGDNLGSSVAVSGDTVVVGARDATVNGNAQQGAAYVFVEPGAGWASGTETAKLTASDGESHDTLGWSVAVSGDTVVAGALGATVNGNLAQGAAYVFVQPANGWTSGTETQKLTESVGAADDYFGFAVGVSGVAIVVGAPGYNSQAGAAYVFQPPVTLLPASLDFGSEPIYNTSSGQQVTLTNEILNTLNIASITTTGDFSETDNCDTSLTVGSSCTITVSFTPTDLGTRTGTLTVTDDAGGVSGSTQTASLSGTGTGTTLRISPSSLSFGSEPWGSQTSDQPVTVTNTGSENLAFTNITLTSDFIIDSAHTTCSTSTPVAPLGTCNLAVAFAPPQGGSLYGALLLWDNAPDSPQAVTLSGTGAPIAPTVTFTGAPASAPYQSTFTVSATTNASTTATITASPSSVCTIAGNTVTMTSGTGTCTLEASWAADSNYQAATAYQYTTASQMAPTVSFTGAPASAAYQSTFTVTAARTPPATATLIASGACSISGSTVTMTSGTGTCSLTANWAADNNYSAASATQVTVAAKATPTVTFTGAPANAVYRSTFTVTATTNASTTATITVGGVCSISGNAVTMTSGTGTCLMEATWAGDANYRGASATQSTNAQTAGTNTSITAHTPNPSLVGQAIRVTFAVSVAPLSTPATGNVTASDGTGDTCTASVATGHCALIPTSAGSLTLTAAYGGDSNYSGSTSPGVAQTVNEANTETTITGNSPNPSVVGQPVAIKFRVEPVAPGSGTPTGNVTVSDGVGDTCTVTVATERCSITFTTAGTYTLTASYAGDSNFNGSTSLGVAQTVNEANTKTAITRNSPNPSVVGQPVTIKFRVEPVAPGSGTPTGNVTVSDGVGDTCTVTVATGSCSISFPASGAYTLTASYAGDSNFNGSTSAASMQTVNKANTVTAITGCTPDPSVLGQSATCTFTVTAVAPGSGTPTGNVTVSDTAGDTCTATVATGSCSITFATAGSKTLKASYAGDGNFNASTSARASQKVTDFTISAAPASRSIAAGKTTTYTITLAPVGGFTGSVALSCGGAPSGGTCGFSPSSVSLTGSGGVSSTATIGTSTNTTAGTYTLTFTGTFGSGGPATGGLTHSANVTLTLK